MARKSRKGINKSSAQQKRPYFAGLYLRISVDDVNSTSNATQEEILRCFLQEYEDIMICDMYIDEGISSFGQSRPAFNEMLKDIKAGRIDCVVVRDISRFTRNYIEACEYLENIFPFLGMRFISALENYDSLRDGTLDFNLMLRTLIAYKYSNDLSKKVSSSYRVMQERGEYLPARLPYGHKKAKNETTCEWEIDEKKAVAVKQIFMLAYKGISSYMISGKLNQQEIAAPMSQYWTTRKINTILKNRTYLGEFITHKTENNIMLSPKAVKVPESEWIRHPNHHSSIISNEIFDDVQQRFYPRKGVAFEKKLEKDFFRDKLYCGICGRKMKRKHPAGRAEYYVCPCRDEASTSCSNKSKTTTKIVQLTLNSIQEKIHIINKRQNEFFSFESSPYSIQKNELSEKIIIECTEKVEYYQNIFLRILENHMENGTFAANEIRGLFDYYLISETYYQKKLDSEQAKKLEREEFARTTAQKAKLFLQYANEQELTMDMLNTIVEKIEVFTEAVKVSYY